MSASLCSTPVLGAREVHVWTLSLDDDAAQRGPAMLPAEDRRRARRLRAGDVRQRWVAARIAMREVLGAYLGRRGDSLLFVDTGNGKPGLAPGQACDAPCFNLSHAGTCALLAVTRVAAVGVDVERVRPMVDMDAIAARFFAPVEQAMLSSLAAERRRLAFYECWTRKEALLKATGEGIGDGLARLAVSCGDDRPARILSSGGLLGDPAHWTLQGLPVPAGYVGALAVRDPGPLTVSILHHPGPPPGRA